METASENGNRPERVGNFSCDSIGNFSSVDKEFLGLFGYSEDEIYSMNLVELVHVDDLKKSFLIYEQFIKDHRLPANIVLKCVGKEKKILRVNFQLSTISEKNTVAGFRGTAQLIEVQSEKHISDEEADLLTKRIDFLNTGPKRTFNTIREIILIILSKGQLSINEIANQAGINWKTVENHLTYLIGKKLVKENFTSKYVRLFSLTKKGLDKVFHIKSKMSDYLKTKVI
jgi:PAS domain S-box-containing protein